MQPLGHYRAPMRSRLPAVDPWRAVQRALAEDVCGIGGRLPTPPTSLVVAIARTTTVYDERTARRLRRFADVPVGATTWTRDQEGRYYRGLLDSTWRYDATAAAAEADLVHVRRCAWEELDIAVVPEAVRASFARGGLNFQRIRAAGQ